MEKLFEIYSTLSAHFLYEKTEDPFKEMMPIEIVVE